MPTQPPVLMVEDEAGMRALLAELPDMCAGAGRWLAKLFTPGELLDAVRAVLRRARGPQLTRPERGRRAGGAHP
jgi:DNA-binding response OmpR family regulator